MINEGISELLFTSDGIEQMEATYYPELPGGKKIKNTKLSNIWVPYL